MDAILGLAALALTGLVAIVAILWLVPLLIVAAVAASVGDARPPNRFVRAPGRAGGRTP